MCLLLGVTLSGIIRLVLSLSDGHINNSSPGSTLQMV